MNLKIPNILASYTNMHCITEKGQSPKYVHIHSHTCVYMCDCLGIKVRGVHYYCLCRIMSIVQHKMDQEEEEEAAGREPQQWKEVVEDIWREHLPHFRGAVYTGEGDFLFDASTGQYGFQYDECASDGEDDLLGGGVEEEVREDEEFAVVPEEEQPHSVLPSLARDDECEPFLNPFLHSG